MENIVYPGNELDIFQQARNWKNYWGGLVTPYLGENVLDVGAGIGATAINLIHAKNVKKWYCIEPDPILCKQIPLKINDDTLKLNVENCSLDKLKTDLKFDTILYIDVIEHIEDHLAEVELACSYLNRGGYLVILVPAHNYLYNNFDKAIGHYRRYNKKMLQEIVPHNMINIKITYLDTLGYMASLTNKYILKQDIPSLSQVKFWDTKLLPVSKVMDKITGNAFGKSLLGVWKKK